MENNLLKITLLIANTKTIEIANLVGVTRSMADKYKDFSSLPPLDKAIMIEDTFNIPPRAWVELKRYKDSEK